MFFHLLYALKTDSRDKNGCLLVLKIFFTSYNCLSAMVVSLWSSSYCHSRSYLLLFSFNHTSVKFLYLLTIKIALARVTSDFQMVESNDQLSAIIFPCLSAASETTENSILFYTAFPQLPGAHIHFIFGFCCFCFCFPNFTVFFADFVFSLMS